MNLQQVFATVLNMSLTGSVVIGFVLLARLLLRRAPKVFSYALWAVVLFRLLCPVSVTSTISALGLADLVADQAQRAVVSAGIVPAATIEFVPGPIDGEKLPESNFAVTPENRPAFTPTPDAASQQVSAEPVREPICYAVIIWLVGIGAMVLYSICAYCRLKGKLTGALHLGKRLYLADHIPTAFVVGTLRPRIYLPSNLKESEQSYIIAHERYHIRRKDHIAKLLGYIALCIHWFNPLVWLAFILSGKDMEMSCDEAVIRRFGPKIRAEYSASLLRVTTGYPIIAGTPLAFGEGDAKGRVLNMAKWKKPRIWVCTIAAVLCLSVLTVCAVNPAEEQLADKAETTPPTQEVPQPTQEVPQPTQEVPQPTQEVTQPTQEVTQPAQKVPQPAQEVIQPPQEVPQPPQEVPQSAQEVPQSAQEVPQPAQEAPQPPQEVPQPPQEVPQSAQEVPQPPQEVPQPPQEAEAILAETQEEVQTKSQLLQTCEAAFDALKNGDYKISGTNWLPGEDTDDCISTTTWKSGGKYQNIMFYVNREDFTDVSSVEAEGLINGVSYRGKNRMGSHFYWERSETEVRAEFPADYAGLDWRGYAVQDVIQRENEIQISLCEDPDPQTNSRWWEVLIAFDENGAISYMHRVILLKQNGTVTDRILDVEMWVNSTDGEQIGQEIFVG